MNQDSVNHPSHYGGEENPYEVIKVIDAWNLPFTLGNSVKYIARAGKKNPDKTIEDLKKAKWYIEHEIKKLEFAKTEDQNLTHNPIEHFVDDRFHPPS